MSATLLGFTLTRRYVRSLQGTSPFAKGGMRGIFAGDHERALISYGESEKPPERHFAGAGKVIERGKPASVQ